MRKPQPWPIFICYRRADGSHTARRVREMLDNFETRGPENELIVLDVYLDMDMPGVPDWHAVHEPYLARARAIIVICTPGLKINEGPQDWVHKEIDWWLANRTAAPILIDPLAQEGRYIPDEIKKRWPNVQRLTMLEDEWRDLPVRELKRKAVAVRRQILGTILPSGAEIYVQELEQERRRAEGLKRALAIAQASSLDAWAATQFAEARFVEARWDAERSRRQELQRELSALSPAGVATSARRSNLQHEIVQVNDLLRHLTEDAASKRAEGNKQLAAADSAWRAISAAGDASAAASRSRPAPPGVFSIELINAGSGESILVHYGTPDATFLVMINGGDRAGFKEFVEPRLRQIGEVRFGGRPVPIGLFIASDQDHQKTEGLFRMLRQMDAARSEGHPAIELKQVWANIFETAGSGLRPKIRSLIDSLGVPLNRPFDNVVMRPRRGRVNVTLPGGLEITVLGPTLDRLADLHRMAILAARKGRLSEAPLPRERFSAIEISSSRAPLSAPLGDREPGNMPAPNEHASSLACASYADKWVPNLASTILLFRFSGKTFLHTGDSRGDLVLDGLAAARLMDPEGRSFVDLLHVPHMGSAHNVTRDFFERVRAGGYLLSGDGAFGNPAIATVASLIAGRGYAAYTMYFVNRDAGKGGHRWNAAVEHGKKLDEFFKDEQPYAKLYRRVFRSNESGSLVVDLLDPVRY